MNRTTVDLNSQPRAITLPNDFGKPLTMTAALVAEDIHFSTGSGVLTVEKLYRTPEGRTGYGIIAASSESRERRAYSIDDQGENIIADNGAYSVELPVADLCELLCMALQAEDALKTVGEHAQCCAAVNHDI
jgi:hypothetical protein